MNQCFFCGPTENKITEEHVWPLWVSELLRGKYGSDHFIHIRSTGSDTTGLWKSPNLKVTTETVCDRCHNNWLSAFENDDIRPLATPLILGERVDIIKPDDQWKFAAWAYKMALLLEVAMPPKERSPEFYTADERLQFHQTTTGLRPLSTVCPPTVEHSPSPADTMKRATAGEHTRIWTA
jgi:hypothetical protein